MESRGLPGWVWLIPVGPEALLLPARLAAAAASARAARSGGWSLSSCSASPASRTRSSALITSLVQGDEKSAGQLLLKAVTVWSTNVIAFGLWYWALRPRRPLRRLRPDPPPPDFQFPQLENPQLAEPGWHPNLLDYIYISFTNSIAFSPTDAMPLTRRAKLLMLAESGISAADRAARRRPRGQHLQVAVPSRPLSDALRPSTAWAGACRRPRRGRRAGCEGRCRAVSEAPAGNAFEPCRGCAAPRARGRCNRPGRGRRRSLWVARSVIPSSPAMSRIRMRGSCAIRSSVLPWFVRKPKAGDTGALGTGSACIAITLRVAQVGGGRCSGRRGARRGAARAAAGRSSAASCGSVLR